MKKLLIAALSLCISPVVFAEALNYGELVGQMGSSSYVERETAQKELTAELKKYVNSGKDKIDKFDRIDEIYDYIGSLQSLTKDLEIEKRLDHVGRDIMMYVNSQGLSRCMCVIVCQNGDSTRVRQYYNPPHTRSCQIVDRTTRDVGVTFCRANLLESITCSLY